jgi:hypothetical protein
MSGYATRQVELLSPIVVFRLFPNTASQRIRVDALQLRERRCLRRWAQPPLAHKKDHGGGDRYEHSCGHNPEALNDVPRAWHRQDTPLLPLCFHLLGSVQEPQAEQHASSTEDSPDLWRCPKCGGPMKVIERLTAAEIQLRSPPMITAAA